MPTWPAGAHHPVQTPEANKLSIESEVFKHITVGSDMSQDAELGRDNAKTYGFCRCRGYAPREAFNLFDNTLARACQS